MNTSVSESLRSAPMQILGRMPWSSNATFLVSLDTQETTVNTAGENEDPLPPPIRAVYKPAAGEQPLWDFPPNLWRREVAAFELSESLGFGLVPPTVHRSNAPYGEGSLQLFIPARFEEHYFTLHELGDPRIDEQFMLLCAFDFVANAADRKAGHCLIDTSDHIWAIDNGLCFHEEFKLRTVIWDFAGIELPNGISSALEELCEQGPPESLEQLLDQQEIKAITDRAAHLLQSGSFPFDPTGRRYPWPLV